MRDSEGQAIPCNGGSDGSVWIMGKWSINAMGQWIVDAMRFQKIFGLYGVEHCKVEKWSGQLGSGWVWWV